MFLSRVAFVFLLSLVPAAVAAAYADEPVAAPSPQEETGKDGKKKSGPTINIRIPPDISKLGKAYGEEIKKLSVDQVEKLKTLEDEYRQQTMPGDTEIIHTTLEFRYCAESTSEFSQDLQNYEARLGVLLNHLQAEQTKKRILLKQKRAVEASFIDQKILDGNYIHITWLGNELASQLMLFGYDHGSFKKTDCQALHKKLDGVVQAASVAAKNPDEISIEKLAQIKLGAKNGDPESMVDLGICYIIGRGVDKDHDKGMDLVTRAAETGHDRAQYMLGLLLGTDMFGGVPDKEKAREWLQKAAAQGNKKAEAMLRNLDKEKPQESLEVVKEKAAAGDMLAQHNLGTRYLYGVGGVEKDEEEGLKWLLLAAGRGDPMAQSDAAALLFNKGKHEEAVVWMTKAANQGIVNSQFQLASLYMAGTVIPRDEEQALFWYKKAAEGGDSRAAKILLQLDAQKQ